MGRYLASGVMTKFNIRVKRNYFYNDFELEKEIDNVLEDINRIIDTSLYELTYNDGKRYEFSLKPDIFDNNIHELIREIRPLTYPEDFLYFDREKIDVYDKKFVEDYPFACKVNSEGDYYIEINDDMIRDDYAGTLYWIIKNDRLRNNVEIDAEVITMWKEIDKYDGEDETNMLRIINNMRTKYYSSTLSKALIYYVSNY